MSQKALRCQRLRMIRAKLALPQCHHLLAPRYWMFGRDTILPPEDAETPMHPYSLRPANTMPVSLSMLTLLVDTRRSPRSCRSMVRNRGLEVAATEPTPYRTSEPESGRGGRTQGDSVSGEHNMIPHLAATQSYPPTLTMSCIPSAGSPYRGVWVS